MYLLNAATFESIDKWIEKFYFRDLSKMIATFCFEAKTIGIVTLRINCMPHR